MSQTTPPDAISLLEETVSTVLSEQLPTASTIGAVEMDCKRTVVQILCTLHFATQLSASSHAATYAALREAARTKPRHALHPVFQTDVDLTGEERTRLIQYAAKHTALGEESLFVEASELIEAFSGYELDEVGPDGEVRYQQKGDTRRISATYLTPAELAESTAQQPLEAWFSKRLAGVESQGDDSDLTTLASTAPDQFLHAVHELQLVDPAVGTGSMLMGAMATLEEPTAIAIANNDSPTAADRQKAGALLIEDCLYGNDISELAVETTLCILWSQLATEPRSVGPDPAHFSTGEALLGPVRQQPVTEYEAAGNSEADSYRDELQSVNWGQAFPEVFANGGFDVVVTNPPWERLKVHSREFFATREPTLAAKATTADREAELAYAEDASTALQEARDRADAFASAVRESEHYEWTNVGSLNLYSLFAERSLQLTDTTGVSGLLVPTGIATDYYTREFFAHLMETGRLLSLHDFENRRKLFSDIDGRTRFSIVTAQSSAGDPVADFSFFSHHPDELADSEDVVTLTADALAELNPNTKTVPLVRGRRELELLQQLHKVAPVLSLDTANGEVNPWGVDYHRMFDMSNDSDAFVAASDLADGEPTPAGHIKSDGQTYTRVYEGRMTDIYNHRAAHAKDAAGNLYRSGASETVSTTELTDTSFTVASRYYVPRSLVDERTDDYTPATDWFLTFKDITSATNARTMRAAVVPYTAVGNKLPILHPTADARFASCLLANLNSMVYDFACRQKIGNISLNWYIVRQTPVLAPDTYEQTIHHTPLVDWVSERVAELTYTATDLDAWGTDLGFQTDPYAWDEPRRRELRAELDALYAHLYELSWEDMAEILTSFTTVAQRERDEYGEYAYKQLVQEAYSDLQSEF